MNLFKSKYFIPDKYILRVPILPINKFIDALGASQDFLEIFNFFENDVVKEAIYLASPSLFFRLNSLNKIRNRKESEKLSISFYKYISRMSTRCTPYGIFAGCSVGEFSNSTKITIGNIKKHKIHTRLDMELLQLVESKALDIISIRNKMQFVPNSSIVIFNNQIRYIEKRYINDEWKYYVMGVDYSPYLHKVIQKAQNGDLIKNLVKELIDDEISSDEAYEYVQELISSQILVSKIELSIIGQDYLKQYLQDLGNICRNNNIYKNLIKIDNELKHIDNMVVSNIPRYEKINKTIKEFNLQFKENHIFHTDLYIDTKTNQLSYSFKEKIVSGLEILNRISEVHTNRNLEEFMKKFYNRYEEQEVSMLVALDPDVGIGYGTKDASNCDINPLVDDLIIQDNKHQIGSKPNVIQAIILSKYIEAISNKQTEILITDVDLLSFPLNEWDSYPESFYVMGEVFMNNDNNGETNLYISSAGGASALNLISRFCMGNQDIRELAKFISKKENEFFNDAVLAEIVHLPQPRTGNIIARPSLRKYEIPYLTRSKLPIECQLEIKDLLISVPGGRHIKIRSKSINKFIIPRLSTSHNFSNNSLPIYEFLCDMQSQGIKDRFVFNLGVLYNKSHFLPRIKYKDIYISLSTWLIDTNEFKSMLSIDKNNLIDIVRSWRINKSIPKYVRYYRGDNHILIDLDNSLSLMVLYTEIKDEVSFLLEEFPFSCDSAIVKCEDNYFSNQFIFPVIKEQANVS